MKYELTVPLFEDFFFSFFLSSKFLIFNLLFLILERKLFARPKTPTVYNHTLYILDKV